MNTLTQLKEHGTESLTDLQMLANLIGETEARNIFNTYENLANLSRQRWEQIKHETFVGEEIAQKTEILSAFSRRVAEAKVDYSLSLESPEDAAAFVMPKLNHLRHEAFVAVFLNNAKRMIGHKKISEGGKTATIVDPAAIMKSAILKEASSMILAHNHPSGNLKESRADVQLTKRLVKAGKLLSISIDDHIIISNGDYISLKAKGLMS